MKKIFFLLTLSLAYGYTNAQKIDTTLLYGRWDLYSMSSQGLTICRDSIAAIIQASIMDSKGGNPNMEVAYEDSLLVLAIRSKLDEQFKTYFAFDKKGNSTVLVCENGECREDTGQYKWTARNQITQKKKGADTAILTILNLTATRLVIRADDLVTSTVAEMTFTRAK